jgi:hypothetical protein
MATKQLLANLAATVRDKAQQLAPEVTGELRRSVKILSLSETEAAVGHDIAPNIVVSSRGERIIYPIFVHEGTAAHIIEPKNKKALSWSGGANVYVRKKVLHPGTKAQPYFNEALKSPEVDKVISAYGDKTIKDLSLKLEKSFK